MHFSPKINPTESPFVHTFFLHSVINTVLTVSEVFNIWFNMILTFEDKPQKGLFAELTNPSRLQTTTVSLWPFSAAASAVPRGTLHTPSKQSQMLQIFLHIAATCSSSIVDHGFRPKSGICPSSRCPIWRFCNQGIWRSGPLWWLRLGTV